MLSNVYLISILGKNCKIFLTYYKLSNLKTIQVELLLSDLTYMDNVCTDISLHFHSAFVISPITFIKPCWEQPLFT